MLDPAAAACLVTAASLAQRSAARLLGTALGAVDMATVAMAANEHLRAAGQAKKEPARHSTAGRADRLMVWTPALPSAIVALHSCPARCRARRRCELPGSWDRRRACLSIRTGPIAPATGPSALGDGAAPRNQKEDGETAQPLAMVSLWSGLRPSRRLTMASDTTAHHYFANITRILNATHRSTCRPAPLQACWCTASPPSGC
jgi:hypothetical protein